MSIIKGEKQGIKRINISEEYYNFELNWSARALS
jgi:hypothetical protein